MITWFKQLFITLFALAMTAFVAVSLFWLVYGLLALYTGQVFGW